MFMVEKGFDSFILKVMMSFSFRIKFAVVMKNDVVAISEVTVPTSSSIRKL